MAKEIPSLFRAFGFVLSLALSIAPSLQASSQQAHAEDRLSPEQQAAVALNHFAWQTLDEIRAEKSLAPENILFSPLSAWLALTMASNGARGETLEEMQQVLGLDAASLVEWNKRAQALTRDLLAGKTEETLRLANSVWVNSEGFELNPLFRAEVDNYFSLLPGESISRSAPFSAMKTLGDINGWVDEKTAGLIPTILDRLDQDMMLILLNALYFQGQWQEQFARGLTQTQPFFRADGKKIEAPTLRMIKAALSYSDDDSYKMLSLNFRSAEDRAIPGRFQLDLVVPSQRFGNISQFKRAQYEKLLSTRRSSLVSLVKIPKFKFEFTKSLNSALQAAGMRRAFSSLAEFPAMGRSFSGMPISIDKVLQKTAVEMDENGFKAAAVTAISINTTSAIVPDESSYKEFVADQPFFFALRDTQTGALIFQGILQTPET